jgi:hypothetical protein
LNKEHPRTEKIFQVIQELVEKGQSRIRPGDVSSLLRDRNAPLGAWEIRAEFSRLEKINRLYCDEDSGDWLLVSAASLQSAG